MGVEHISVKDIHSNEAVVASALHLHHDVGTAENQTVPTSFYLAAEVLLGDRARVCPAQQI